MTNENIANTRFFFLYSNIPFKIPTMDKQIKIIGKANLLVDVLLIMPIIRPSVKIAPILILKPLLFIY
jgi:hypothetical protein